MIHAARAAAARRLERGGGGAALAEAWSRLARARWAPDVPLDGAPRVVSVVGSRLGGSQATPTVLSLGLALSARGARAAIVTRAFGAAVSEPRAVSAGDHPRDVGDEALWLARASSCRVIVSGSLDAGVAHLGRSVDVVVVDGRARAHTRLLCHDPDGPLACPPAGDLRAPLATMRAWATHEREARPGAMGLEVPEFAGSALLATAIARPRRVRDALAGVALAGHLEFPDHGGPAFSTEIARALTRVRADVVLCTEKCATWLPARVAGLAVRPIVARALVVEALVDSV